MSKLHEIVALAKGRKSEVDKTVTRLYQLMQKPELFDGRIRAYKPLDEVTGDKLPEERQIVQQKAKDVVNEAFDKWTELLDVVCTQDKGNQEALGTITIDDKVIVDKVPITTLLMLEKISTDMETLLSKMPTPDPKDEWSYDATSDTLKTSPEVTVRTKKVPMNHVLAAATDKHPAQVQMYHEDKIVGHYEQTLFSGRMAQSEKNDRIDRVRKFRDAVKLARERANTVEVKKQSIGKAIKDYILS